MQPSMQQLSFLLCVSTAVPGIVNMAIKQICCHLPLRGSGSRKVFAGMTANFQQKWCC